MNIVLVVCIITAIGIVASVVTGFYAGANPALISIHMVLGVLGIFLLGYLTYVAFTRGMLYVKILSPITLVLGIIMVLTGLGVLAPPIHIYVGVALIVMAILTGYAGFMSARARMQRR